MTPEAMGSMISTMPDGFIESLNAQLIKIKKQEAKIYKRDTGASADAPVSLFVWVQRATLFKPQRPAPMTHRVLNDVGIQTRKYSIPSPHRSI